MKDLINLLSDISPNVAGALLSLFVAVLTFLVKTNIRLGKERAKKEASKEETHIDHIAKISDRLRELSDEMDRLLVEVGSDLESRKSAILELQKSHSELQIEEASLRKKVETLKSVPVEVAEYFRQINDLSLRDMERRNMKREVLFFVAGVVITTIISIAITLI